jgi:RNA polymerase subunit RPABC4/transcription elongation factor Spt4
MRLGTTFARIASVLGILAAAGVALLLLATWGHIETITGGSNGLGPTVRRSFSGGDLPEGFQVALIALSGAVIAAGVIATLRPARYPLLLAGACLATIAQIVLVVFEWLRTDLFSSLYSQANVLSVDWSFTSRTLIAALVLGGVGACIWLALTAAAVARKVCPDCAERVPSGTIECPHCGYEFPLPAGLKRCETCHRAVKAEARVCRYCRHRFGEPVEQMPTPA